ncbi:MAG: hypothetical protein ABI759_04820 [Candidatus Solibacter sp.]
MNKVKVFAATLACFAFAGSLSADAWNKRTKVKFSGPVSLPSAHAKAGVVTLPAGTYIFRLNDSQSARHIVQVTNERGDKLYTTILAIPDYRLNATSKTVMYFSERPTGHPQAIKSWFYPGDNYGHRFVYPKAQAVQIAAEVKQPVPSHEVETVEVASTQPVELHIQTPAKVEAPYVAQSFDTVDATDTAGVEGESVKAPATETPAELPKTASPIYLVGLLGLALVSASLLVRRVAVKLQ